MSALNYCYISSFLNVQREFSWNTNTQCLSLVYLLNNAAYYSNKSRNLRIITSVTLFFPLIVSHQPKFKALFEWSSHLVSHCTIIFSSSIPLFTIPFFQFLFGFSFSTVAAWNLMLLPLCSVSLIFSQKNSVTWLDLKPGSPLKMSLRLLPAKWKLFVLSHPKIMIAWC